jgi:hypothetical protein
MVVFSARWTREPVPGAVTGQAQSRHGFSIVVTVSETIVVDYGWWRPFDWARA